MRGQDKKHRWATWALALGLALSGCATGPSRLERLPNVVTPLDAAALAALGWWIVELESTPSWSAKARENGSVDKAFIELERAKGSEEGSGGASMAFHQAAEKWCKAVGMSGEHQVEKLEEYWEPMRIGAIQKARGSIKCEDASSARAHLQEPSDEAKLRAGLLDQPMPPAQTKPVEAASAQGKPLKALAPKKVVKKPAVKKATVKKEAPKADVKCGCPEPENKSTQK